jgi:hypothetical protein
MVGRSVRQHIAPLIVGASAHGMGSVPVDKGEHAKISLIEGIITCSLERERERPRSMVPPRTNSAT